MTKPKKQDKAKKKKIAISNLSFWSNFQNIYALIAILLLTAIVFLPSLNNNFVNWDDDKNFYENALVLSSIDFTSLLKNIPSIFSSTVIGNYNPLSHFTFALENVIFGLKNPFYWHLDNLILHLICVMLIFRISLALGLNIWSAIFCALLFGIHPLRVESVAWITERKDVLFGSFYLAALYYYIKGVKDNQPNKYLLRIIILFILSGLSKIQAVSLPLSMLAVDYFMNRKIIWERLIEKWFYFGISLLIGLAGVYFLNQAGSLKSSGNFDLFDRIFIGSYSYIIYYIKLLVPFQTSPMYPYPPSLGINFYLSIIPTLLIIGLTIYSFFRKWKALVFGIVFFTFNIMFLLQIVGAGQGFIADRFTYIAYFGLFFTIAYYFQSLLSNQKYANYFSIGAISYLAIFAYLSFNQNKVWKNSETLWTHVIKYYPNTTISWGNRANYYRDQGRKKEALSDYSTAIGLGDQKAAPYNSRAKLYFQSNYRDTLMMAVQDYSTAISIEPTNSEYYTNRGATFARLQDNDNAIQDLIQAAEYNVNNPNIYLNRSIVYHQLGQYQNEINDINIYLKLNPNNANMWANRANANMLLRNWEPSLADINQAIKMNPNYGVYYFYRAQYYFNTNNLSLAQQDLDKAVQLGFQFNGSIENLAI